LQADPDAVELNVETLWPSSWGDKLERFRSVS
jgi:hypothetical protein